MPGLSFSGLPFASRLAVWWSFFWRGIVITIGSSICGAILGGIAGFLLAVAGVGGGAAIAGGLLGLLAGCAFVYLYVHWLLSSRLGKFRLLLVRAEESSEAAA